MVSTPWKPQQSCKSDSRSRCQKYRRAGDSLSLTDISSIILNYLHFSTSAAQTTVDGCEILHQLADGWSPKKIPFCTAVHKNPNVPIVTNWCRISQPSTISCHIKSWLLPLDVVPKKSYTLLQEMQPTKHPGLTSPKRTWWLCIEYGKPWHFDAFWATLCTLKSHQKHTKNTLTSPYRSNAQSGARGIYHIVVLQECSCFGTSTRNTPSWKYQKNIQSPLVCHMLSYSNGHSGLFKWTNAGHLLTKTLFSAWNDWNKWKFRSTTNYKHVQMLIEI